MQKCHVIYEEITRDFLRSPMETLVARVRNDGFFWIKSRAIKNRPIFSVLHLLCLQDHVALPPNKHIFG